MTIKRWTKGDAILEVSETEIAATAPATAAGFSDLVVLAAVSHEAWRISIPQEKP